MERQEKSNISEASRSTSDSEYVPSKEHSVSETDHHLHSDSEVEDAGEDSCPILVQSAVRPRMKDLFDRLAAMTRSEGASPTGCFMTDPEWPNLEAVPMLDEASSVRLTTTDWCSCTKCSSMPTIPECNCCREEEKLQSYFDYGLTCITEDEDFKKKCLDKAMLEWVLCVSRSVTSVEYATHTNRSLRKCAYRSYTAFVHGFLGPKVRIPIPACVVNAIRQQFPEPGGTYVGFHWQSDYEASSMALDF